MELPPLYNIEAKQGDTFSLSLVYQDDAGVDFDVTGYTAEFSLAVTPGGSPSFTYTEADYITVGTTDGMFTIEIPAAVTRLWIRRRYAYEITVTDTTGVATTILEGRMLIRPEVVA